MAVTTVTSGLSQTKGIPYTVITYNYAEQCKIAFCEEFGWTATDVTVEAEIAE